MKSYFVCSLCHKGLLGGGLIVDEKTITYKTGKVTVESKYRNLVLDRSEIQSISWKWVIFPVATFEMKSGEKYSFLIFNKRRFLNLWAGVRGSKSRIGK